MTRRNPGRPQRTPPAATGGPPAPARPSASDQAPAPSATGQSAQPARHPAIDSAVAARLADYVQRLHDLPGIRAEKVSAARRAIEAGTYEDDAHLDGCLGRLEEEIGILCRRPAPEPAGDATAAAPPPALKPTI